MPNEQIERQNWRAEQLICTNCEYIWVSVFPEEAVTIQCPICQQMRGIPVKGTEDGVQNRR